MDCWLSIEVFDAEHSAASWRRAYGDNLIEAALTHGGTQWEWHEHRWGVVLEIEFTGEEPRDRFRHLPAITAALDAVPDPVSGLLVYPGRGGGAGSSVPRGPKPLPTAAAAARAHPQDEIACSPGPPSFIAAGSGPG